MKTQFTPEQFDNLLTETLTESQIVDIVQKINNNNLADNKKLITHIIDKHFYLDPYTNVTPANLTEEEVSLHTYNLKITQVIKNIINHSLITNDISYIKMEIINDAVRTLK